MSHIKLQLGTKKGWTSVRFLPDASGIIMTSSESAQIKMMDLNNKQKAEGKKHDEPITDFSLVPGGVFLVTASADHTAMMWTVDEHLAHEGLLTRLDTKIHSIAASAEGHLVACGADRVIRLVNRVDSSTLRSIKGHEGFVTSLAFDTQREYLASASTDGTVKIWKYTEDDLLVATFNIANKDHSAQQFNRMAWNNDGSYLAVATDKGVALISRQNWQLQFLTEHEHKALAVAWSKDGSYLASSHDNQSVLIWDVATSESTYRFEIEEVTSIDWHPKVASSIVVSNMKGQWAIVENVTVKSKKAKKPSAPSAVDEINNQEASMRALLFDEADEAEEEDGMDTDDLLSDVDRLPAKQHQNNYELKGKRLMKHRAIDDGSSLVDPDDDIDDFIVDNESLKSGKSGKSGAMPVKAVKAPKEPKQAVTIVQGYTPEVQATFQPNASSMDEKRRYLAWNTTGSVVARYDDASTNIEVEFSDQSAHKNFSMNKSIRITHATLGNKAVVLASDGKDGNASSVLFCQFESWAHNSDWTVKLEHPEHVEAVAVGDEWVAVATSSRLLRLFTASGIQRAVLSLAGDVVSMVGNQRKLAVVFSAAPNMPGDQNLNFMVLDVQKQSTLSDGALPLSRKSRLEWIGFSDEDMMLCSFDSAGILRALVSPTSQGEWGKMWSPICETENSGKGTRVWPIGIVSDKLIFIPKQETHVAPSVLPRPTPTTLPLQIPILNVNKKEEEYMRESIKYFHVKQDAMDKSVDGVSWKTNSDMLDEQVKLDKLMTEILATAASGDKLERAYDAATMMLLRRSLTIGLAVVQRLNQGVLAQKMQSIAEQPYRFMHDVVPSSSTQSTSEDVEARPTKRQRTSMETHQVTAVDSEQDSEDESAESEQSSSVKENERNATNLLNSLPAAKPEKKQPATVKANPFAKLTAQPAPTTGSIFTTINSMKTAPANNKKRKLFN